MHKTFFSLFRKNAHRPSGPTENDGFNLPRNFETINWLKLKVGNFAVLCGIRKSTWPLSFMNTDEKNLFKIFALSTSLVIKVLLCSELNVVF